MPLEHGLKAILVAVRAGERLPPTLVIRGRADPLGPVAVAVSLAGSIPHAQLKIMAGGHGPWLGEPERTALAIVDLVSPGP